jgi:hypothetical protein
MQLSHMIARYDYAPDVSTAKSAVARHREGRNQVPAKPSLQVALNFDFFNSQFCPFFAL